MIRRAPPLEPLGASPGDAPREYDAMPARLLPHMRKQSPFFQLARARKVLALFGAVAALLAMGYIAGRFVADGRAGIEQVRVLNQGSQVAGAARLHGMQDSGAPPSLEHLREDGYLRSVPPGWKDGEDRSHAETVPVSQEVCEAVNRRAGLGPGKRVVEVVRDSAREQTGKFGCVTETRTVFFKY